MKKKTKSQAGIITSVRLSSSLLRRLEIATNKRRNIYAPSRSKIMIRGIELALREMANR